MKGRNTNSMNCEETKEVTSRIAHRKKDMTFIFSSLDAVPESVKISLFANKYSVQNMDFLKAFLRDFAQVK